jgi:seryl-tRNA synthetase
MLYIKFIRDNLDICKTAAKNKNRDVDWDGLLALDDKRRELIGTSEKLRSERNTLTREDAVRGKSIKQELKMIEDELRGVEEKFGILMLTVPNIPDKSVPIGKDASGNVEVKKWPARNASHSDAGGGKVPKFDFEAKDHIELAKSLDLIDFERGAKVGGSRAYFLKNEAAQLEFAVLFYTFNKLVKKGYTPMIAPSLVRDFTLFGNGQFPWGREEVYHLEKDDLYLAGTAEVPMTAYFANEVLEESDLPKKFVAFSPCFMGLAVFY